MALGSSEIVRLNVGGHTFATSLDTLLHERSSLLFLWFEPRANNPPLPADRNGAWFIDRDPNSFAIVLNYLRLRAAGQLWEACLPKDPDRLALLTQEAEYFRLGELREQALQLLQCCTEKHDQGYVSQVLIRTVSCPLGLSAVTATPKTNDSVVQQPHRLTDEDKLLLMTDSISAD